MDAPQERWISRTEAARRAGVHYNTIRNEWEPRLRTKRVKKGRGYEVLIELASLDAVMAERHTAGRQGGGTGGVREAALEAENRELRSALAKSENERRELLDRFIRIAENAQE